MKNSTILFMAICLFLTTLLQAQEKQWVTKVDTCTGYLWDNTTCIEVSKVYKTTKSFTIDGKKTDWADIPVTYTIDKGTDVKLEAKFAWNENYLFVLFDVKDDVLTYLPGGLDNPQWYSDGVEFCTFLTGADSTKTSGGWSTWNLAGTTFSAKAPGWALKSFFVPTATEADMIEWGKNEGYYTWDAAGTLTSDPKRDIDDFRVKSTVGALGYIIEARLGWDFLNGYNTTGEWYDKPFEPKHNSFISYFMKLNDNDNNNDNIKSYKTATNASNHDWRNPVAESNMIWLLDATVSVTMSSELKDFSIFPNPAFDQISISSGLPIYEMEFVAPTGNVVKTILNPTGNMSIADLPNGLYIVKATGFDGKHSFSKFIKK